MPPDTTDTVDLSEPRVPRGESKPGNQTAFLVRLKGKRVAVYFTDGSYLHGVLFDWDPWSIQVDVTGPSSVVSRKLIFKHAIRLIEDF